MGQVSYFAVKNHRWSFIHVHESKRSVFPLDETWSWAAQHQRHLSRALRRVGVRVPAEQERDLRPAHVSLRQVDPDGGAAIARNGNTTIRVEKYGSQKLSAQNILNLRASKESRWAAAAGWA